MKAILPQQTENVCAIKGVLIKTFFTTCILLCAAISFGQITMSNTVINGVCNTTYYDQGGIGNYTNNKDITQTFYPSAGSRMTMTFTAFVTETNYDYLYIYNGNSTSAPLLAKISGSRAVPFTYSSTAADGSLTFRFITDGNTVYSGWVADIGCESVPYRAQIISANTGSSVWCPGESRNISVQIKNTGSATWTNSGPDVNIGVKWDANGSNWLDYMVRTDANNLAPQATGTFNFTLTASNIPDGTLLAEGANNISFDVVREAVCWFANNGGVASCGPGNSVFSVPVTIQVLKANPITGDNSLCANNTLQLNSNASGPGTITWYSTAPTKATVSNTGLVSGISAGTTNIYYVVSNGTCSATSAMFPVTISSLAGSIVATENSGNSLNDNNICQGSSVTFTATPGFNAYTFKVNNSPVQSGVSNLFNTSNLNNGDNVTVDAVNSNNCSVTFGPVVISVYPLPTGTLSASENSGVINDNIICKGSAVNFNATAGFVNYTFRVNGDEMQTGSSSTFSTSNLQNGDSVKVEVTNTNGCKNFLNTQYFTVLNLPVGVISVSENSGNAANDNIICKGGNVTFTATAGFSNYNFLVNGVSVQISSSNIYNSDSLSNPSIVTVIITSLNGCENTSVPVIIEVKDLPAGTLSVEENSGSLNDGIICKNSPVNFIATPGFNNYVFKINTTEVQNGNSNILSSSVINDGDKISVEVSGEGGCVVSFNDIIISVLDLPTGLLQANENSGIANDNTICAGDMITFTAPAGYLNYSFFVNNNVEQNGNSNTFSASNLLNGAEVKVLVTSSNGCSTELNSIIVSVNSLPVGTLAASENSGLANNDNIICKGDNVTFTATAGFNSYEFFVNGESLQSGNSSVYSTSSLIDGSAVTVIASNSQGCTSTFNSISISVKDIPSVNLNVEENSGIENDLIICPYSNVLFSATPGFQNYDFRVNGISVQSSASNIYNSSTLIVNSNVKVIATNVNGCTNSSSEILIQVKAMPTGTLNVSENSGNVSNDGIICSGTNVNFNATAGYSDYEFSLNGSIVQSGSSNIYSNSTLNNDDSISVKVTHNNGCNLIYNPIIIKVNQFPVLDPIEGDDEVCVNNTIILNNTTKPGEWTTEDESIAVIDLESGELTGVSGGTVRVTYTYTNEFGCATSVTKDIIINALPTPTLSGPNPFCPNTVATYTTETNQFNYNWTITGGTIISGGSSTDNDITVNWNLPGAKTIFVNYNDIKGCSVATSSTVTGSTGTVPTISGPALVCQNSTGNFYSTQSGQTNYVWTVTGGIITSGGGSTDDNVTIKWTTSGNQSVKINFTDINGCTPGAPTNLTVKVNPVATGTLTGNASVCLNSTSPSVRFAGASGLAPYTFTYNIDGGDDQTITTVSAYFINFAAPTNVAGNFTYNLTSIKDSRGCENTASGSITVVVNSLPTATISGSTEICNGTPAQITFTGNDGVQPYRFYYNINGGPLLSVLSSVGNTATVNVPLGTPNTFTYNLVSVQDAKSCSQLQPASAIVKVNPLPTATISGAATVCENSTSPNVIITGSGGTAPYTFNYKINGSSFSVVSVGDDAIIPVPTNTFGNFTYSLESVTDASATACVKNVSGSVLIKVQQQSNGGTAGGSTSVCEGSNSGNVILSGYVGTVTGWQTSVDGGLSWTPDTRVTTNFPYSNLNQTTWIRAIVQNGVCSYAYSSPSIITVNTIPVAGSVSGSTSVCATTNSGTVTLSGYNGTIVNWESSTNGGSSWTTIAGINAFYNFSNLTQTTLFRAVISNGVCSNVKSTFATITVKPRPTATLTGPSSVCIGSSANLVVNVTGSGTISGFINGTIPFNGTAPSITVPVSPTVLTSYNITSLNDENCSASTLSGTVNISVNGLPSNFSVTPSTASLCQDNIIAITSAGSPTNTSSTFTSTAGTVTIPDATTTFFGLITLPGNMNTSIPVSGIPGGAIINSISVQLSVNHGNDGDLVFNLRAPNAKVLNLINRQGGSGNNFTNTTISSAGTNNLSSYSAPFTGTFAPDGANADATVSSNVNNFSALSSTINGTWTLYISDLRKNDQGSLAGWSITINYTVPSSAPVKWSPLTDLYTNSAATTVYTGTAVTTVYVKPSGSGTKTYTATSTNGSGCSTTATATLNVNAAPVITFATDYCSDPGKVRITASAVPASTFLWYNGSSSNFILVDEAGSYSVTATTASGCKSSASTNVAQELVINGDFEQGNIGFTSAYGYVDGGTALNMYPEGIYTVGSDAHYYHNQFFGRDHTSGAGNFMIINGSSSTINVWQQTITVLPNTTYYFSAWAASVNNVSPFAQLQFNVNGNLVGTTAVLAAGPSSTAGSLTWVRFYGSWTSGPSVTTAIVSIRDLQTAPGGNDFGIDDVSFGTLSTFIQLESAPGTNAQSPCVNTAITPIVYSVGSSASGPIVTGLPAGITGSFNGTFYTISGSPTVPGNYTYTLKTTGSCNPTTATGTINVTAQTISLLSGSTSATSCIGVAMADVKYTLGGTANNASVTGLPPGVSYSVNSGVLTISGTPSAGSTGVYNYVITTSGTCAAVTKGGSIEVKEQIISLTSSASSESQIVCINTPISNIIYTPAGSATSLSVSGLPTGIVGNFSGGILVISGTPTVSGTFNYTVNSSGSCLSSTKTRTITVNPTSTISLTSAAGSNIQPVCSGNTINNIIYTLGGGANNASVTGLPAGISGSLAGNTFTISGSSTVNGVYNYIVTTSGGCAQANSTGTITIQSGTIQLYSGNATQTVCNNATINNVVYAIGGTATGATVSGLPAGISGNYTPGYFTISGASTVEGSHVYTISLTGSCSTNTISGTINIGQAPNGGTLGTSLTCASNSAILTLTNYTGTILQWETSTDGGNTWNVIVSNSPTRSFTNINQKILCRVLVKNGTCNTAYSTIGTIDIRNVWVGGVNSDWFNAANWSGNTMPSTDCNNITIPVVASGNSYPVIGNSTVAVNNLIIQTNASLTILGGTLQVAGAITSNNNLMAATATIELNGDAEQFLSANTFQNNSVNNLLISNTSTSGVSLLGSLELFGSVTFSVAGKKLNTNDNLTLKSTADNTAWVGNLTGKLIDGKVTVERYIHSGVGAGQHGKGWQLLSVPTFGSQTINAAWQEGSTFPNQNLVPGYGTMITGHMPAAVANGFDVYTSAGGTMKTYNPLTNNWDGVLNTKTTPISNTKGYLVFVRGDRSVITSNAAAIPTILRTKGQLYSPLNPPPVSVVQGGKFESIGNPYASAIDMTSAGIIKNNMADMFYVWDPQLTNTQVNSAFGLGGYQTFTKGLDGNYHVTPGGGSYGDGGSIKNTIESGQAIIMKSSAPTNSTGTVTFTEGAKISGSNLVTRPNSSPEKELRTNILGVFGNEKVLLDGVTCQFDDSWSNDIDEHDASKLGNFGTNFGMVRNTKLLAVERRKNILVSDTIYFQMGQVKYMDYVLQFNPSLMDTDGLTGYLIDSYLRTSVPVSMTEKTEITFNVNSNSGSYAANRFMLVFQKVLAPLPVTITSISANRNRDNTVAVKWQVENEINIEKYEVERSDDGRNFTGIITENPVAVNGGSATYIKNDMAALKSSVYYYRIKAVSSNGLIQHSSIVRVNDIKSDAEIKIYPNPVTGKIVNISFSGIEAGKYKVEMISNLGQVIVLGEAEILNGSLTRSFKIESVAAGHYVIVISNAVTGFKTVKQILVR